MTRVVDVSGTIRESGGGPVQDARVDAPQQSVLSDAAGRFVLNALTLNATGPSFSASLSISREGFESRHLLVSFVAAPPATQAVDIVLQRVMALQVGVPLAAELYPDDLPDYVGEAYESEYCATCKKIRFASPPDADLQVVLSWSGSLALQIWALSGAVTGTLESEGRRTLRVPAGQAGILLVGTPYPSSRLATPLPFTLDAAAVRPN